MAVETLCSSNREEGKRTGGTGGEREKGRLVEGRGTRVFQLAGLRSMHRAAGEHRTRGRKSAGWWEDQQRDPVECQLQDCSDRENTLPSQQLYPGLRQSQGRSRGLREPLSHEGKPERAAQLSPIEGLKRTPCLTVSPTRPLTCRCFFLWCV